MSSQARSSAASPFRTRPDLRKGGARSLPAGIAAPAGIVPPWNALPPAAPPALGGNRADPSPP